MFSSILKTVNFYIVNSIAGSSLASIVEKNVSLLLFSLIFSVNSLFRLSKRRTSCRNIKKFKIYAVQCYFNVSPRKTVTFNAAKAYQKFHCREFIFIHGSSTFVIKWPSISSVTNFDLNKIIVISVFCSEYSQGVKQFLGKPSIFPNPKSLL